MRCWRSFVAVGDSFTEGLDDPYPDSPRHRGWADLVAGVLAARVADEVDEADEARGEARGIDKADESDGFGYANLAVRGRLFDRVVAEQLPVARAMRPELVSFAAGGNDVLRRRFDPEALAQRFDDAVGALRALGAQVVVFRFADVTRRLPGQRVLAGRAAALNEAVGDTAGRHDAVLVDLWADDVFHHPALWSVDRLHLSPLGHRRVAAHVLTALGVPAPDEWWRRPPATVHRGAAATRAADAAWLARHLLPWVGRRLTGRSSGDGVTAKRPTLSSFAPVPAPRTDGMAAQPEAPELAAPEREEASSGSEGETGQRPVG